MHTDPELVEFLQRHINDANIEQTMLERCAQGKPEALASFVDACLDGTDHGLVVSGRLQHACGLLNADDRLLRRWQAGNGGAAKALLARHYPSLHRFVTNKIHDPDEAADVVQNIMKDVTVQHRTIQKFRPFLFTVAVAKVKQHFRGRYKNVNTRISSVSQLAQGSSRGIEVQYANHLAYKLLVSALNVLPVDQQMILELYIWEEFTAPMLAELFNCEIHTIRHAIRGARTLMRQYIENEGERVGRALDTVDADAFFAKLQELARNRADSDIESGEAA